MLGGNGVLRMSVFRGFFRRSVAATLIAMSMPLAAPAGAVSLYDEPKYAAIVVDTKTGEVLYSRRADLSRAPASITKIMTLYLAFEAMERGDLNKRDLITMSRFATWQAPSRLGLGRGQKISVDAAIRVIATKSANDVSVALAEKIGGSEEAFARMMTEKARELGMKNTVFRNASGLHTPGHVTTARDIAILSLAVIKHFPEEYRYFSQTSYTYGKLTMENHNRLLKTMPGVDGIKTGYTGPAGFTLAASAVRDDRRLIAVVLGGPSTMARDQNVRALLDAGFNVLAARSGGQRITVAANLNEPNDFASLEAETSMDQGSGEGQSRKR